MESKRGNWSSWYEFLFSIVGLMVGLGNIWRFPYICYKNGGGAFLVPYVIFIILFALPIIFLQLSYSQYSNLGPGKVWICCPLFKGIGYGMVTLTFIVSLYYNVILAWALYYLGNSFLPTIPWGHCKNDWNTESCFTRGSENTILNSSFFNITTAAASEKVSNATTTLQRKPSTEEFWEYNVLEISNGINEIGIVRWQLLLCLFIAWFVVLLCLIKGIKTSGKVLLPFQLSGLILVPAIPAFNSSPTDIEENRFGNWVPLMGIQFSKHACLMHWFWFAVAVGVAILTLGWVFTFHVMYVAATIPYVFLTILLIRGLMLPGAVDGMKYFLIPRWHDLLKFSVWGDAAVQVFYSHGLGAGGTATLASYNYFHNNCYRDAIILPIIDVFTSLFAGMVIFVTLGFMAHDANVDIGTVVKDGPGIAFMVYPEALSKLPLPQLWSVLFFLMLFTVGVDSQIAHVQTLAGALMDNFPHVLHRKKFLLTASLCLIGFVLGIPCITQGGVYVLTLIDWYCASISVMFLALMENFALAWLYGVDQLYNDIEMMLGYKPSKLWKVMWKFVTPMITSIVWLWSVISLKPVRYGNYVYPTVAVFIGWLIALTSVSPIPIGMAHTLGQIQGAFMQRLRISVKPTKAWKPAIPANAKENLLSNGQKDVNTAHRNTEHSHL